MSTFYRPDDVNTPTNRVARAYRQLLVTFDDLHDLAESSGAPRAIVELGTSADEDDGADAAADDGPADAAAVESLAVWSYRQEDGALVNRRSVVVYDHAGPPRVHAAPQPAADALCARRWEEQYQNLKFLSVDDYFSHMKVSPPPAVAAAAEVNRAPERN
jgi:hypothetical protein